MTFHGKQRVCACGAVANWRVIERGRRGGQHHIDVCHDCGVEPARRAYYLKLKEGAAA